MNRKHTIILSSAIVLIFQLIGCGRHHLPRAQSRAELESGYTYIPLDAFPIDFSDCDDLQTIDQKEFFNYLPDNSIRTSIRQFDLKEGKLSFTPVTLTSSGYTYEVVSDYINSDTISFPVRILQSAVYGTQRRFIMPFETPPSEYEGKALVEDSTSFHVLFRDESTPSSFENSVNEKLGAQEVDEQDALKDYKLWVSKLSIHLSENQNKLNDQVIALSLMNSPTGQQTIDPYKQDTAKWGEPIPYNANIPIYVGVGLRVTADVVSFKAGVNVGLTALTANADAESLQGTLTVQTLGVNGPEISGSLPQDEELNRTTVRGALTSIATIRAKLYQPNTILQPRVLGMYLPFPADQQLINQIVSAISKHPPKWEPVIIVEKSEPSTQ